MIFITGCTGLVGSHLVSEIVKRQRTTDNGQQTLSSIKLLCRKNSDLSLLKDVLKRYGFNEMPNNIEFVYGDVLDYDILEDAMQDTDEVYHCAAVVSFDPSDKGSLMRVNVEGTRNMVNAALHCGVKKFCHVSSIAALGRALEGESIDEESPWTRSKNNSVYSNSKHEAEMEVWRGIAEGLNATIVNPSLILGAGRWDSSSCELFNVIAKGFPFYTTGINGFVDVKDVARAMITLMENNKFGQRYCLNGALISYQNLFNLMAQNFKVKAPYIKVGKGLSEIAWRIFWILGKLQGKKPLITKETARTATRKYSYSSAKIIRELDFKFTHIEESIKEICDVYKAQNLRNF
ncbi:MAG: NAD-dependent epimerase/dehydratase family protein [Bacteroidales bacterium]|nr:NAD-dependent epimerase/dehydratase family protein [Bacteroidales bacterium]